MRFSLELATLLCFVTWMSLVYATHGPVASCCLRWSKTRVRHIKIMNYTIQPEGICPTTAVVFQTKSGKRLCSDPNSEWAKTAILMVEKAKKELLQMEQNEQGSTSDMEAAVSTKSKKAPRKKGRRISRRGKNYRRGRKGQRKPA
ncbi:eotaxin-like [Xiphias gladius]|uniref:eotaxin-like n=1 Tax=Xiphias gladius TaxID=8245 RepID=UPI001A98B518|nr:eotaxin-like [Xiphias gladius]